MRKLVKTGAFWLLGAGLALGTTGCGDDDPDYSNVTPPAVTTAYSVSGRVTGMDGNGLTATVSMDGNTVKTAADGTFLFDNVKAGSYTLKAEADGKLAKKAGITLSESENGVNRICNLVLSNAGSEITAEEDGSATGKVITETLSGNDLGRVEVDLAAPAGAVAGGSTIILTPIYLVDDAATSRSAVTKANEQVLLIGTSIAAAEASATLQQPLSLVYDVDPEMAASLKAEKYVDGKWVAADFSVNESKVTVTADRFTSYSLVCDADISSSTTSESVDFTQSAWDNLYGSGTMNATSASYSYKVGTEIAGSASDRVTAYLLEILARRTGTSATSVTGNYPVNVSLPVGTGLTVSATQAVENVTVSALGKSVTGKSYGAVSITAHTYNRQHTGGSN